MPTRVDGVSSAASLRGTSSQTSRTRSQTSERGERNAGDERSQFGRTTAIDMANPLDTAPAPQPSIRREA